MRPAQAIVSLSSRWAHGHHQSTRAVRTSPQVARRLVSTRARRAGRDCRNFHQPIRRDRSPLAAGRHGARSRYGKTSLFDATCSTSRQAKRAASRSASALYTVETNDRKVTFIAHAWSRIHRAAREGDRRRHPGCGPTTASCRRPSKHEPREAAGVPIVVVVSQGRQTKRECRSREAAALRPRPDSRRLAARRSSSPCPQN